MTLRKILEKNAKVLASIASLVTIVAFYLQYFNPNIIYFYDGLDMENKIKFIGILLTALIASITVYVLNRLSKLENKIILLEQRSKEST